MARAERPLSPHLQVYRWYFTLGAPFGHRGSGVGMAPGLVLLPGWLLALASGPDAFGTVQAVMHSWLGVLVLFVYTFVLFYHMANGVRHLVWDAGYALELPAAINSGIAVLAFAGATTVLVWLVIAIAG